MSKNNTSWKMDEPVEQISAGWVQFLLGMGILFFAVCTVMAGDTMIRVLGIILVCILAGFMLLTRWLEKHYRIVMDEEGVCKGRKNALKWTQVRTAAVIQRGDPRWEHYNRRREDLHFILLSVQGSEKAIDKWTFLLEGARPGRDIRIPYTDRRREVVEHYLGKDLPTIRL